jgi:hypothetical protein
METKLKLEHLVPYLPDLKIVWDKSGEVYGICFESETNHDQMMYPLSTLIFSMQRGDKPLGWKPILRPLSDLTKDIEHEGERFNPVDLISTEYYPIDYFEDTEHLDYLNSWVNSKKRDHHILFLPYGLINQLIQWKFDIHNLIEQGLAIPVTETFNPYK